MKQPSQLLITSVIITVVACSGEQGRPDDARGGDTAHGDSHAEGDQLAGDPGSSGDADTLDDFQVRSLASHAIVCTDGQVRTERDLDTLCRIEYGPLVADVYVQATPVSCVGIWQAPTFEVAGAWSRINDTIAPIAATYDYGGNHHNDSLHVTLEGTGYTIWHSSIGFGYRACAPPDCLLECDAGATCDAENPVVDGCAREPGAGPPPHPIVCVRVQPDGTIPPLLDPWRADATDPDYPLLPCAGET